MNTSITVTCYKSKTLANGEHPLMLRITQDRRTKYKSLNISVLAKHWDFKKNLPKSNCPNKELIMKIILKTKLEYQQKILEKKSKVVVTSTLPPERGSTRRRRERGKVLTCIIHTKGNVKGFHQLETFFVFCSRESPLTVVNEVIREGREE